MDSKTLLQSLAVLMLTLLLAACPSSGDRDSSQQPQWHLNDFMSLGQSTNIWSDMADNFTLQDNLSHHAVRYQIALFSQQPAYIKELTHNAQPYLYYVYQQTQQRNIPAELALIPMIESDYNPFVYSSRGATGLWQMMPGTASGFGLKINWWYDGRRDIIASTHAALNYLQYLHKKFGDWLLAIAAYNSGEGTIMHAIKRNQRLQLPTDFWHLKLPKQTERYVPKILALAAIIQHPERYKLTLQPLPNQAFFDTVPMSGQINLSKVAYLANTSVSNIRLLNPGFRRWATSPSKDYTLVLPKNKIQVFNKNLNNTSTKTHQVTWLHHKVRAGDSLYLLAKKYNTRSNIIKRVNKIKNNVLHINQDLLIPLAAKHIGNTVPITTHDGKASIAEDKIPGPRRVNHTVAKNDNLWTISKRYHVKPDQIRYWNSIGYHQTLQQKQQLVLWLPGHHHNQPAILVHKIKPGESLSSIATHYHTSTKKVMAWNNITNPNHIRSGQKIHILINS